MTTATITADASAPAMIVTEVAVHAAQQLTPAFRRVVLVSPDDEDALAEFGVEGASHDQRVKLVFPPVGGFGYRLPDGAEDWYSIWTAVPEDERGSMRTYTVRDVVDVDTEQGRRVGVVVDFVIHVAADGTSGPASRWAATAGPGARAVIVGPHRRNPTFGGIEFAPGDADDLLLVGDETAVPAIAAILDGLPADARGRVVVEVPTADDILDLHAPQGMVLHWFPRGTGRHGDGLLAAVRAHLGCAGGAPVEREPLPAPDPDAVDVWETPTFSSSGEALAPGAPTAGPRTYAWVAGESSVVTTIRRLLVREVGLDRRDVAFMGYWREGVAMRS